MKSLAKSVATRMGLIAKPGPTGGVVGVEFYDDAFSNVEEYGKAYWDSGYYFAWTVIGDRIRHRNETRILEVGCGPGQLSEFLADLEVQSYFGFDFSPVGIEMCQKKNLPRSTFVVADATDTDLYSTVPHDVIICTEVLEHIEDDLGVVSRFAAGKRCLCTVPSFPYVSHVRHFTSEAEVAERYGPFFDDFNVWGMRRPNSPDDRYFLFEGSRSDRPGPST